MLLIIQTAEALIKNDRYPVSFYAEVVHRHAKVLLDELQLLCMKHGEELFSKLLLLS